MDSPPSKQPTRNARMSDISVTVAERLTKIETLVEQVLTSLERVFTEFKSVEDRFRQYETKLEAKNEALDRRLRALENLRERWGGVAAMTAIVWPIISSIIVALVIKLYLK